MKIQIKTAQIMHQYVIIPTFGIINRRSYYGYPCFSIACLWLCFGVDFKFGVKTHKNYTESEVENNAE